jgi:hypothetical protein
MPTYVRVFEFQPFESRRGVDTVIGLRFGYDPELVACLKQAVRVAKGLYMRKNLGGWLAKHKAWFVEKFAWPGVRRRLEALGCTLEEDFENQVDVAHQVDVVCPEGQDQEDQDQDQEDPEDEVDEVDGVDMQGVMRRWHREMVRRRGGTAKAVRDADDAYNLLWEMWEEARDR